MKWAGRKRGVRRAHQQPRRRRMPRAVFEAQRRAELGPGRVSWAAIYGFKPAPVDEDPS